MLTEIYYQLLLFVNLQQEIYYMEITIKISEQQLECLRSGKRIPGSLFMERTSDEQFKVGFYVYGSRLSKRRREQTLMRMEHGSIKKTARNYKLILSLPDVLGEVRCGELMRNGGVEADSFMRHLNFLLNNE
jgi:hypothetical protein